MVLYNAGVVDPRMVGGVHQPQAGAYQPAGMPGLRQSPVMSGMAGSMSPAMQANLQGIGGIGQFQLPQAAFVQNPSMLGQPRPFGMPGGYGEQDPVTVIPGFEGSDVYIANQGVIVGRKEKRYVRIRWGDGQKGHKSRWVGFAPSDWKMNRSLNTDPTLLGFYVKPNLCDRSNKSKRNSGWVTLSIDCAHRAIKATIDGWTLGKVFIPTWLIGRVMRPVAVAEAGMHIKFDLNTEEGCEKVLRAGFLKWSTITNTPLSLMRCQLTGRNFESAVLGMSLDVSFDEEENVAGVRDCEDGYISYNAVDRGLANTSKEVIPLVINDRHAFRVKERGLWDLFYADGRVPLDYLSERMTALIRKIYEAKHQNNRKLYKSAVTKLAHFRHILFFLAKNQKVVEDANSRVQWFLSNKSNSGVHIDFTPDLGRLLTCVAVSDYEWEDIAVPFFAEALQRSIPHVMQQIRRVKWFGPKCCLEDLFDAFMTADKALAEMLLHVIILTKVMKPHHKQLDEIVIERLSAEELCCGIAGLSTELQILEYERSSRKDEIKKTLIKREWQQEFTPEQWDLIEGVLDNPLRLRGMLNRSRMIAECHGSCGLPTPEMYEAIDEAHDLGKTVENFKEYLECYSIAYPGDDDMFSIVKKAILMATRKGYIDPSVSPAGAYVAEESRLLSARQALSLNSTGSGILNRQGRTERVFMKEVLPRVFQNKPILCDGSPGQSPQPTTREGEGEPSRESSRVGEPNVQATSTLAAGNYPHLPVLVNNVSNASSSYSYNGSQYQYVQMAPNMRPSSSQHSTPGLGPQQFAQLFNGSAATTPGSIRLPAAAIPTAGAFPEGRSLSRGSHRQHTNRTSPAKVHQPRRELPLEFQVEGNPRLYGYTPTPMGLPYAAPQMAQHEGQPHYVLAPNGIQLLQV